MLNSTFSKLYSEGTVQGQEDNTVRKMYSEENLQ